MSKMSTPLKWHGGKQYLAKRIIELMPPHVHYVEPYFGGGQVLFAKNPEGVSEVVNDINGELINFWTVLRDRLDFEEFRRQVEAIPFAEAEWQKCLESPGVWIGRDIERAVRFFVRYRQSRQGLGQDFATLSRNRTRRGMNEQVSSWLSAIDGLPDAHERLRRVAILNRDAVDVIRQQDGPNTCFYLDPPYLHETRAVADAYEHEMTAEQHRRLLGVLASIEGRFLLSGYPSSLYDEFAIRKGWRHVDFDIDNKASGAKSKRKMIERVWMNF